jgi:DNA-binding transcriptional LysR family regulator
VTNFSLKQLEVFVSVTELNSFTRAADELYLTQSTVSAHIRSLENALGVRLFARDARRNISLTTEGQKLYPAAKRVLTDCAELRTMVQSEQTWLPLSLGASTVPAQYLLPKILAGFLKLQPDCRYQLKRGDSAQIHEFLKSGVIRIGFVGAMQETDHLAYVPIATDRLVLVTENSPAFQKLQHQGVLGRDLLAYPIIAREEGSGTDRTAATYLHQIGFSASQLHIIARIDNPETIKRMVARGAGVTILSALAVEEDVSAGKLLTFDMDSPALERKIYMVYPKSKSYNDLEQVFQRFVRETCSLSVIE